MDFNFKCRKRERAIAAEVANELYTALKPAMDARTHDAQSLIDENRGLIAHVFGMACERHQLTTEAEAARVFGYIPAALADLLRRVEISVVSSRKFRSILARRPPPPVLN
jgi:hypothetical protein